MRNYSPTVLIILDGFGVAPPNKGNACALARKPNLDDLFTHYPTTSLVAAGEAVGLPRFGLGNSEVGHMNLGAGRVMYQELPRIDRAIANGSFFNNPAFLKAIKHVQKNKSNLHIIGLVSSGGVHSHSRHLYALIDLMAQKGLNNFFIHAFLDGRDAPRDSAIDFIDDLQKKLKKAKIGKIATLSGRFYAMDRDQRWERTKKAYQAMVYGIGPKFSDPIKAIKSSYQKKVYDEEFIPCVITEDGHPIGQIHSNDAIIFFNFRADRARQISQSFVSDKFEGFDRGNKLENLFFVCMTEYLKNLPVEIAFPPIKVVNTLGEVISKQNQKQLRIAETEKYAHVTYFFNCGRKEPYFKEDRIIIPSPKVTSYDQKPEMSAYEVTSKLVPIIESDQYSFFVINFANPDMVGHTGNIPAAVRAIEAVDDCVGKVVRAVQKRKGACVITADHGNADVMINLVTGKMDKEHTVNPVPLSIIAEELRGNYNRSYINLSSIQPVGVLSDVSTTILSLAGVEIPSEMTGVNLLELINTF